MAEQPTAVVLPEALRAHFWDHDPERLRWDQSRHTIVLRLLEKGGLPAIQWLRAHMSDDEIRDFIARRKGRGLSPRRLRLWGLLADIPRSDVDAWVANARLDPWHDRVHR